MQLLVSLLVLVFSICSMGPYLLANRIPVPKDDTWNEDFGDNILAVNPSATKKKGKATYSMRPKLMFFNALLSESQLYGQWRSKVKSNDDNIEGQQGFANMKFQTDYQTNQESFDFNLCLYKGLYTNTNYTCLTFSEFIPFITDSQLDLDTMTLTFNNTEVHKSEGITNGINPLGDAYKVNATLYFVDTETNQRFKPTYDFTKDRETFTVRIRIQSQEAGLDIITSNMTKEDALTKSQSIIYAITMTLFATAQCGLCYIFTKSLEKNKVVSQKINQGTVRIIGGFDLYIAMESLLQFTHNMTIGLVVIPYAILAIYFETKAMRVIMMQQGNLNGKGQTKLHILNTVSLVVSLFMATFTAFFQKPEWMFGLFVLHPLPQIIQNFITERRHRWKQSLILSFVLPKIAYIFYVLGFPLNLFRYSPNIFLLTVLVNVFLFLTILLLIQSKYPNFFLKRNSPYQFFEVPENGKEVCSICLEELDSPLRVASPSTASSLNTSVIGDSPINIENKAPLLQQPVQQDKLTMVVTPCKHQFHESCLRDWAKLKSVCPYCRAALPPLPEGEQEE